MCRIVCKTLRSSSSCRERGLRGTPLNQHYFPHMDDIVCPWSIQVCERFLWKAQCQSFMSLRTESAASSEVRRCVCPHVLKGAWWRNRHIQKCWLKKREKKAPKIHPYRNPPKFVALQHFALQLFFSSLVILPPLFFGGLFYCFPPDPA